MKKQIVGLNNEINHEINIKVNHKVNHKVNYDSHNGKKEIGNHTSSNSDKHNSV
jgi:hypothetical protein